MGITIIASEESRMATATSATVKALAHPIRVNIISAIAEGVDTPGGIAALDDKPLGVVSYHVRMLRDYGVIEVYKTEPRRGALQHFYRFTNQARADLTAVEQLARRAANAATDF